MTAAGRCQIVHDAPSIVEDQATLELCEALLSLTHCSGVSSVCTTSTQKRRRPFRRPGMLALPVSPRRGRLVRATCTTLAFAPDVNRLGVAADVRKSDALPTVSGAAKQRSELRHLVGGVTMVFFDFDGTLTASPGELATATQKHAELRQRASMLAPCLELLRQRGVKVGIISRSTEMTIRSCLQEADLENAFDGPIVGRSFRHWEGKTSVIQALVEAKALHQVLLVDDDAQELERAWANGIQTYPAPALGGLQKEDFDTISQILGFEAI